MNHQFRLAIALLMVSISWITWMMLRRAEQQHQQRMGDLTECARQLEIHQKALQGVLDHPAAPPMQKELAIEVRTALADRASIDLLAKWMLTPEPSRAALPAELGSILAGLRSVDPDLATAFERCVDSGFVAGVLRWPETAAMWRALSARFLSEPDRELLVATQVWRGSHHAQPVAAALV